MLNITRIVNLRRSTIHKPIVMMYNSGILAAPPTDQVSEEGGFLGFLSILLKVVQAVV